MHGVDLGFGAHPVGREIKPPEDVVPVPVVARFHPCGELMSSQLVGEGLQAWLTPSPSGDFFLIGRHFTYYSGWSKDPAATFALAEEPVVLSAKGGILSRLRPAGP
jgi:hypothetical protein